MAHTKDEASITLWGPISSFYSGKARAYLIKKGIPFRELNPSHPHYMTEVVPRIGHFALPVVEFADGTLIQDSTEIILHFEALGVAPDLTPSTPVQQVLAWLLGCFGSEAMWKLGLHYRWTYLEQHRKFIEDAFGRPLSLSRSWAGRQADALPLMAQFAGKLTDLGVNTSTIPGMEAGYEALLDRMNEHLFHFPYLMGPMPTLADFGFIAPLFAHLARDPYPSNHMKLRAPNVFRWTERMFEQGFMDAEFPDLVPEFLANDVVPETTVALLAVLFEEFSAEFIAMTASFNAWCAARPNAPAGTIVQDPQEAGTTHPSTAWIEFDVRGVRHRRRDSVDIVYHLQRVFEVVDALHANARARFDDIVKRAGGTELMAMRLSRRIAYSAFRYELA